jgi:hypothetical protein
MDKMAGFIKEVSSEEAHRFMEEFDKRKMEYGIITEFGAVIPENADYIVELGSEGEKNYIASKGFLQRSEDGILIRLMKDGKRVKIPNFEDIFEIIDLSKDEQ